MPFSPSPHTPYQWSDSPAQGTMLDSDHLIAAEQDLVSYTQQTITAYDTYAEGQFMHQQDGSVVTVSSTTDPLGRTNIATSTIAAPSLQQFVSVMDSPWNAKGDAKQATTGAITTGSNTLTGVAGITSADQTKPITVAAAGP